MPPVQPAIDRRTDRSPRNGGAESLPDGVSSPSFESVPLQLRKNASPFCSKILAFFQAHWRRKPPFRRQKKEMRLIGFVSSICFLRRSHSPLFATIRRCGLPLHVQVTKRSQLDIEPRFGLSAIAQQQTGKDSRLH